MSPSFVASGENSPTIQVSVETILTMSRAELTSGLVETAGNLLLKGWIDGGASAIASLGKVLSSFRLTDTNGAKAWSIVTLAFAAALDQIKSLGDVDVNALLLVLKDSVAVCLGELEETSEVLPRSFLQRPTTSPLYLRLRDMVVLNHASFVLGWRTDQATLTRRIDAAFNRSLFQVWSSRADHYASLANALNAPGGDALERELNWGNYRALLVHEFSVRAMFGQEESGVSLSQLYVPLRAYWQPRDGETRDVDRYDGISRDARPLMLDSSLLEWATSEGGDDWLRLVGGDRVVVSPPLSARWPTS